MNTHPSIQHASARNRPYPALVRLAVMGALAALGTGCSAPLLDPRGPIGRAEKAILLDSLAIMLVIVVPTILATLTFAWWFRGSNRRARYRPDWAYSGRIELITWSIPILVVLFLGGMTWVGSHELDPGQPLKPGQKALDVQVVSLDWKWLFIYPEQRVASVNQIVVPAGMPVHLRLTSASVLNTFFVPQLGSMIYTMNGMADELYLEADEPGVYAGLSGHFSGDGFSDMHFQLRAVPQAGFTAWVLGARAAGPVLDAAAYAVLARQSSRVPPFTYSNVTAGLFESIVRQHLPAAPGPPSS